MAVNKEDIEKEVKHMLSTFSKELSDVEGHKHVHVSGDVSSGFREDSKGEKYDEEFRARMFENAHNKNKDFIIAEKGNF